jgi:threonine dehydrogenase-like Zn-dependent dehydrogenase
MQALVFDGELRLDNKYPAPVPGLGDALIRVRLAGICGTDREITRGYKGYSGVLGHEFVGEVVACEDSAYLGRRVCADINITCGTCRYCAGGMETHCSNRTVIGIMGHQGCFAEYLSVPIRNLHLIPDSVADDAAVMVEPLAAALHVGEQVALTADTVAVVLGDGPLGALCALALRSLGCAPISVGKHPARIRVLAGMGLETTLLGERLPTGVDLVVEATGSSSGLETALAMVRPRGTIVVKSTLADRAEYDLSAIAVKEITVVGSRCGAFRPAIAALDGGAIDVGPLISETLPLSMGVEALRRAAIHDTMKVLVRPEAR